jgi:hypothetical protein
MADSTDAPTLVGAQRQNTLASGGEWILRGVGHAAMAELCYDLSFSPIYHEYYMGNIDPTTSEFVSFSLVASIK